MKISEIQRMQQLAGIKINESEVSDHLAAKMIADKLQGTPNLTFQTIEQMVPRYLEMVGKAPTDAKYISVQVYDILSGKGLAEEGVYEASADDRFENWKAKPTTYLEALECVVSGECSSLEEFYVTELQYRPEEVADVIADARATLHNMVGMPTN
jgi:hypothetical protein